MNSKVVEAWGISHAKIEYLPGEDREGWVSSAVDPLTLNWCIDHYAFPFIGLPLCPLTK